MKQVLKVMIIVTCLATSFVSRATPTDEITLTVSSDGPTKDEAVKNTLRSAIEQAFGAFVSANTTILNDELIKNEIVTVSNGSIKDYKEISSVQTADGSHLVTLTAIVSLNNLISYAKSHGNECEFAGNAFAMDMRLFELQKENERKVLENLLRQLDIIIPATMSWGLEMSEPVIEGDCYTVTAQIAWSPYINYQGLKLSDKDKRRLSDPNADPYYKMILKNVRKEPGFNINDFLENYKREKFAKVKPLYNEIESFIDFNLSALSLSSEEAQKYVNRGASIGCIGIKPCSNLEDREKQVLKAWRNPILFNRHDPIQRPIFLRSQKNASFFETELKRLIVKHAIGFVIKDNTGQLSDPLFQQKIECYYNSRNIQSPDAITDLDIIARHRLETIDGARGSTAKGSGLFSNDYDILFSFHFTEQLDCLYFSSDELATLYLKIPKGDIGKYSKFWIEKKSDSK